MRVVDFDQNLNPAAVETLGVTVNGVAYTLTETSANTGVFEGADGILASGQVAQLVYVDPNTILPGADVCTAEAEAPVSGASGPGVYLLKRLVDPAVGPAIVGDVVRFQLEVFNTGNVILNPVVISDTFNSSKLQFTSANPSPTGIAAGVLTWNNLGPLDTWESKPIEVVFRAIGTAAPTINNAAVTATPPSGPVLTESANASVIIVGPALALSKTTLTPADRQAKVGENVTFRIAITNTGSSVMDVLPLVDNFDAVCLAYVSASPAPSATGYGTLFWQDLTQAFGQNLALGASFTVDVTLRALEACDPAVNAAAVEFARDVNGNAAPPVSDDDFVRISAVYDFGDAPAAYGTLLAANGARHALSFFRPLQLGAVAPDAENDGQPNAAATGDDTNGLPDDEDALAGLPALVAGGTSYALPAVPVSNTIGVTATLYAWLDFDADGVFEPGEFTSATVASGATSAALNWSGVGITSTAGITTYLRLRLTSDALTDNGGTALDERSQGLASNGEVEDYALATQLAAIAIAKTPDLQTIVSGRAVTFTIAVTNTGAVPLTNVTVADPLAPACARTFASLAPGAAQSYTCALANVTAGFTNTATVTGTTPANSTVTASDTAQVLVIPAEANITGQVRYDMDADGALADPDGGLIGVVVRLWTDVAGAPGTVVLTTTTDASGHYTFTTVAPGSYWLVESDPAGFYSTADVAPPNDNRIPVTLPGGVSSTGNDYLDARYGSIGDFVWHDLDADAIQDPTEAGLANVTVQLTNAAHVVITTTTDADGLYTFANLLPGVYTVTIDAATLPAGFNLATTPTTLVVNLAPGQDYLTADFGVKRRATGIGDTIWYDTDADGRQDIGEPPIGNVSLELYLDNGDGVFDPSPGLNQDFYVGSTVSDAAGDYLLLAPVDGVYFVVVSDDNGVLAGLTHTVGPQSMVTPSTPITLTLGQIYRDADFGYVKLPQAGNAIIGDLVWLDGDGDGLHDPGEPILIGVTVCATPTLGGAPICGLTDINGRYLLEVPAGSYNVAPTSNPFGLTPTTTVPHSVTVAAGEQYLDADFGYNGGAGTLAALGGTIWQDLPVNDVVDGIYNTLNEPAIPNVSVNVIQDINHDGVWNTGEPILATVNESPAGIYLFDHLLPGDYLVRVSDTLQRLVNFMPTVPGPNPGQDNNNQAQPYPVSLTAGELDTTADFGYREFEGYGQGGPDDVGQIGDTIWLDVVQNGLYEPGAGDLPIASVTVALYQGGVLTATTTTGANGRYLFTFLPAGAYTVQVTDLFGVLTHTFATTPGPNPGQDNNNQARPYTVTLAADETNLTADFGYVIPQSMVTIGDFAWVDSTTDGVYDPATEAPLSGVVIQVRNSSGTLVATVTTGAAGGFPAGLYLVQALPAGTYTATVVAWPSGYGTAGPTTRVSAPLAGNESDLTLDFAFVFPTAVQVASFTTGRTATGVLLNWETLQEAGNTAFHIERAGAPAGPFTRLTAAPLPGLAAGVGARYEWRDATAQASAAYWYRLVLEPDGLTIGPVAAPRLDRQLFLPLLGRDR